MEQHQSIALKYAIDMDISADVREESGKFHVRNVNFAKQRLETTNRIRKDQVTVSVTRIGRKKEMENALALKAKIAAAKKPMVNRVLPYRNVDDFI